MKVDLIAANRSFEEFVEAFMAGDEEAEFAGVPLIFYSLSNGDPVARYRISSLLLDSGCRVDGLNSRRQTALHILLGQVKHDISQTTELCARLLARGVDPAAVDNRGVTGTQEIVNLKPSDLDLAELFDLWFRQPGLVLNQPNKAGFSPIELAEKRPYRAEMVRRMNEYASS
jgi:hypothetical protein